MVERGAGTTRIALAGFGAWGRLHAEAIGAIEGAGLAAIYCHGEASNAAAASTFPGVPRYRSYEAMLAAGGFDAVTVAVPNDRHASFAVAALDAGAHVILEKPLGVTPAECDAVMEAARRAGRLVAVNHELRVSHQWGKVRGLIAADAIGAVRHQHFSLFRKPFRLGSGGWRHDRARVGSWALEELVHFVDLVMWYAEANGPPRALRAVASPGGSLAETVTLLISWADGSTALVTQCLAGFEHHSLLEIAGSDGAIRTWWAGVMDRTTAPDFALSLRRRGTEQAEAIEIVRSGEIFELRESIAQALDGFRTGRLPMNLADARRAVALCLAAEESAATGREVDLAHLA
jgi:myo-inositol 2-dehydrogenase / D-chiro-inositol 1-dehydrogenase